MPWLPILYSTVSLSHKKFLFLEISEDVIACDLRFAPPPSIKNPGYATITHTIEFYFLRSLRQSSCRNVVLNFFLNIFIIFIEIINRLLIANIDTKTNRTTVRNMLADHGQTMHLKANTTSAGDKIINPNIFSVCCCIFECQNYGTPFVNILFIL